MKNRRENLIPALHKIHEEFGYLLRSAMLEAATHLTITEMDISGRGPARVQRISDPE